MVTSALVITLTPDPSVQVSLTEALASDARVTVGERIETRLPIVVETEGLAAAESLVEAMRVMPGVLAIDVVLVDFDPEADIDAAATLGKHRHFTNAENPRG